MPPAAIALKATADSFWSGSMYELWNPGKRGIDPGMTEAHNQ